MGDFQWIQTRDDLAGYLGVPLKKLTYLLFGVSNDKLYVSFEIPKKNSGSRTISSPVDDLKCVQRKLADALWMYQAKIRREDNNLGANVSYAFEKGRGIIENASCHRNKRYVLNLDLKDFFESFHFGRILGYFEKNRYFLMSHEAAVTIAQLACFNGHLPQGSPASPVITNLICQALDYHLMQIAKKYRLNYTRYADDLTFSTNNRAFLDTYEKFLKSLSRQISRAGFSINHEKTRLQYRDARQEVTGLVVNKKVNVSKHFYKKTRAMAYSLYRNGKFTIDGNNATLNQLEGRFSFIDQLDRYNRKNGLDKNIELNRRERQYQAFLYYKYFFASDEPVLLTEGKTDALYIKAALMNLCERYPNLIERIKGNDFAFHVKFIKRSERMQRFFKIPKDGGDSFYFLHDCFTEKGDVPNYLEYFTSLCKRQPKSPTVILFDNENSAKKPLGKFVKNRAKGKASVSNNDLTEGLNEKLYSILVNESKFYILTVPLNNGKLECEIEDLFSSDLLGLRIGNRSFDRSGKMDSKKYYNKDVMAAYIFKNYMHVDFGGFVPLLDALNEIVVLSRERCDMCAVIR